MDTSETQAKSARDAISEMPSESDDPFDMPPAWLDRLDQAIQAAETEI